MNEARLEQPVEAIPLFSSGRHPLSSRDRGVSKVEVQATPVSVEWVLGKTQKNATYLSYCPYSVSGECPPESAIRRAQVRTSEEFTHF